MYEHANQNTRKNQQTKSADQEQCNVLSLLHPKGLQYLLCRLSTLTCCFCICRMARQPHQQAWQLQQQLQQQQQHRQQQQRQQQQQQQRQQLPQQQQDARPRLRQEAARAQELVQVAQDRLQRVQAPARAEAAVPANDGTPGHRHRYDGSGCTGNISIHGTP